MQKAFPAVRRTLHPFHDVARPLDCSSSCRLAGNGRIELEADSADTRIHDANARDTSQRLCHPHEAVPAGHSFDEQGDSFHGRLLVGERVEHVAHLTILYPLALSQAGDGFRNFTRLVAREDGGGCDQ